MPDGNALLGFMVAALIVLLMPGPGVLYVIAKSVSQGLKAGLASAAGLSAGAFVHVLAAAAGLSAILMTSATAFSFVKFAGAGYLIYLGLRTIFSKKARSTQQMNIRSGLARSFYDGVIVSVFNPKIAVFFLAFLPQFVDTGQGNITGQILFFGLVYVVMAMTTDSGYALLAGSTRRLLKKPSKPRYWPRLLTGSVYVGLGLNTALTGRKT